MPKFSFNGKPGLLLGSVLNMFCAFDGTRAFLHFVCVPLCFVCSSEGRMDLEAEHFQCIDVVLSMRVDGVAKWFYFPFVVTDARVLVRFPCGYGAVSPASLNSVKTNCCNRVASGCTLREHSTDG